MANMTAKEWLSRARDTEKRLKALRESKRRAYDRATEAAMAPRHDFADSLGNFASGNESNAYTVLSGEADRQRDEVDRICAEITRVIGQVDDNILATLLTEYYVNGRSWAEVAAAINYSTRSVTRLHKKALAAVQGILNGQ